MILLNVPTNVSTLDMASSPSPQTSPTAEPMSIPSYFESTLNDDVPSINDNTTLPAYSGRRPSQREGRATPRRPRDFTYKIEKNDHIWANMTITADEKLSQNIPTFVEGEPILGQVELWTEKGGEDIRGVVVSVRPDLRFENC